MLSALSKGDRHPCEKKGSTVTADDLELWIPAFEAVRELAVSAGSALCVLRDASPVQAWGRLFGRSLG